MVKEYYAYTCNISIACDHVLIAPSKFSDGYQFKVVKYLMTGSKNESLTTWSDKLLYES